MALNKGYLTAKTNKESDETFTPAEAVLPLIKHLQKWAEHNKKNPIIWCPFDTEDSEFVKIFRQYNYDVIATHIDNGQNFFDYEPNNYDIIISNPPFSIKDAILKRLSELNHPFAILLPLPTLQGQKRFEDLKNCQALIFDKRINYYRDITKKETQKGVAFASIYVCKDFLEKDLIFEKLETE